jgi:hypothetical protein
MTTPLIGGACTGFFDRNVTLAVLVPAFSTPQALRSKKEQF